MTRQSDSRAKSNGAALALLREVAQTGMDLAAIRQQIKPHQAKHLDEALGARQVGVLLVEFTHPRGRSVFALRWTNLLFTKRGNGYSLAMEDCDIRDEITPYRTLDQVMYGWPQRA